MKTLAITLALAALSLVACNGDDVPPISAADMQMGQANASVEVIEYASASCSHCARFAAEVLPGFKAKYIDTGKVRYAVREILTDPVPYSAGGFILARCVDRERYFPVLDAIYRAQETLYATQDMRGTLMGVAQAAGLDEAAFNACLTDEASKALNDRVAKNISDTAGHTGTPMFFFNGKSLFEGEPDAEKMEAAMTKALAE